MFVNAFNNKSRKRKKLGSKNIKAEMCAFSFKDISMEEEEGERKA